jgi:hypothetical protein
MPQSFAGDSVVIVLDDSGSMNERMSGGVRRIDAAKNAIQVILKQFPVDTKLGLLLLNGDLAKKHWAIPLEHLSVPQATQRVQSVKADGGTPLGDRIREGADALLQLREKQLYGNYRLLIVTDGEANDTKLLALYLPDVLSRGLIVDAIGVDMKQDHSLATRVHSYRRADDAQALSKAVQEVFAEKADSSASDNNADFTLLEALEKETAREALNALSKPNNTAIVGVSLPTYSDAITPPNQLQTRTSFLAAFFALVMSCMVPLFAVFVAIVVILFRAMRGKNDKRTGR